MGLLYINGQPLHDEDQDLIERARERIRERGMVRIEQREDRAENAFSQREFLRSLSEDVRACARARADKAAN